MANQSTLTLTTCNPRYSAATRLVVTADFDPGPGKSPVPTHPTRTTVPKGGTEDARNPGDSLTGVKQQHMARGAVVGVNGDRCDR